LSVVDILDPVDPSTFARWKDVACRNSSIYDEIDGEISVYRCNNIQAYKKGLESYVHRSCFDTDVQESLSEIKGFLTDWPCNLFQREDLSPSIATRAVVPNELWY
jgi:hypothetical protein